MVFLPLQNESRFFIALNGFFVVFFVFIWIWKPWRKAERNISAFPLNIQSHIGVGIFATNHFEWDTRTCIFLIYDQTIYLALGKCAHFPGCMYNSLLLVIHISMCNVYSFYFVLLSLLLCLLCTLLSFACVFVVFRWMYFDRFSTYRYCPPLDIHLLFIILNEFKLLFRIK